MPRISLLGASIALITLIGSAITVTTQQTTVTTPITQDSSQVQSANFNCINCSFTTNCGTCSDGLACIVISGNCHTCPNPARVPSGTTGGQDPFDSGLDDYSKKKTTGEQCTSST